MAEVILSDVYFIIYCLLNQKKSVINFTDFFCLIICLIQKVVIYLH